MGRLVELLREAGLLRSTSGDLDVEVRGVAQDSREVAPGDLFLAWRGAQHDAHDFLEAAEAAGAVGAVVEVLHPGLGIPQIEVEDGRLAAALVADAVAGSPWREMFVAGITGTNGKTTTAILARHLLRVRGQAGAIGTLGLVEAGGGVRPGTEALTTPGPVRVAAWLRDFRDAGVRAVVLEASSHALEQKRLHGVRFDAAVFTNLGRDHLDYHRTREEYRRAKLLLRELLKPGGVAVVNGSDPAWEGLGLPPERLLTFAVEGEAELRATEVEVHPGGSRFTLRHRGEEVPVALPLLGRFNVENALAAAGVALVAGLSLPEVAAALESAPSVPGRLEVVRAKPAQGVGGDRRSVGAGE